MKKTTVILAVLLQLTLSVFCDDDPLVNEIPDDDPLVSELPPEAAVELVSMLNNGPVPNVLSICPNIKPTDFSLLLYTRNNPNSPTSLDLKNVNQIDPSKKIIVVIHGWVAGSNAYGIPELKNAYLGRYDCNLIVVHWKKLAWQTYSTSVCYLPKIAQIVAEFLCTMSERVKIPLNTVHLVGHSLGAQMSGIIGQNTAAICNQKIGRITGMDPAGPLFRGAPISERLDETDAVFVDVMHTNGGFLGYHGQCGHSDFYVNCGSIQPGCPINKFSLKDILAVPVSIVCCHHLRALDYMAESVNSNNFLALTCKNCPILCIPSISITKKVVMGEDTPASSTKKGYLLLTHRKSPYAMG